LISQLIKSLTGSNWPIEYHGLPEEDHVRRRPDITKAKTDLGWVPQVDMEWGLQKAIDHFSSICIPKG
jgi:nucleoside-diphosphate-sugar epimerase